MSFDSVPWEPIQQRTIAVLISGGGTTLANLIRWREQQPAVLGQTPFDIGLVVSSSATAAGLQFAERAGIPTEVVRFGSSEESRELASQSVFAACRAAGIQLVVLGGFLKHLTIPTDFDYRVINIHPSLIPAFAGHGYYGLRVHQAVLDYGCHVSGCTVHFVDNQYDHGPIIAQRVVTVEPQDGATTLQQRVFQVECELYPQVIQAYLDQRLGMSERRIYWRDDVAN